MNGDGESPKSLQKYSENIFIIFLNNFIRQPDHLSENLSVDTE